MSEESVLKFVSLAEFIASENVALDEAFSKIEACVDNARDTLTPEEYLLFLTELRNWARAELK